MSGVLLEARGRHVLVTPLLRHVPVGERLLGVHSDARHIAGRHMALGHPGTGLRGEVGTCGLLGGVDRVGVVDAVIAGGRLRGVQARLESLSAGCRRCTGQDARGLGMPYLNQVLALGLCDERLELGRGEGVDQPGFRHDQEQDLGACQNRELVGLAHARTVLASLFPEQSVPEGATRARTRSSSGLVCCRHRHRCWTAALRASGSRAEENMTNLLHDAGLALGEGDVAARLVADELELDLAALAAALLVVVIVVVGGARAGALDAATLTDGGVAIADGMRVVELGGRGLVVLISDVGHFSGRVSRKTKKVKWWRCSFERCADGLDLIWR